MNSRTFNFFCRKPCKINIFFYLKMFTSVYLYFQQNSYLSDEVTVQFQISEVTYEKRELHIIQKANVICMQMQIKQYKSKEKSLNVCPYHKINHLPAKFVRYFFPLQHIVQLLSQREYFKSFNTMPLICFLTKRKIQSYCILSLM